MVTPCGFQRPREPLKEQLLTGKWKQFRFLLDIAPNQQLPPCLVLNVTPLSIQKLLLILFLLSSAPVLLLTLGIKFATFLPLTVTSNNALPMHAGKFQ